MTSTNTVLPAFITPGAIVARDTRDGEIVSRVSYALAGDRVSLTSWDGITRTVNETACGRLVDRLAGYRPATPHEITRFEQLASRYNR